MKSIDKIRDYILWIKGCLYITWDFKSHYKSLWVTGWLLITWRYDGGITDIEYEFYPQGWE